MSVSREMCRHPIKDNSDSEAMHIVYKISEVLRSSVSGGWRIVVSYLITPGTIKRIFCDSHKLNMCISHIHKVRAYFLSIFSIVEEPEIRILYLLLPGTYMTLIDGHRFLHAINSALLLALLHPLIICPFEV